MKIRLLTRFYLAAVLCAGGLPAGAEIIGYDSFAYTSASSLTGVDGGSFWDFRNAATARHSTRASAWSVAPGFSGGAVALAGGVLYTENYGVVRTYGGPDLAGENAGAVNNDTQAKQVYYRITLTRGTGTNWCGVSSFDFGTERLFFGVFPDGTNQFSIYDQNTATLLDRSAVVCTTGTTYTLVAKVDYAADRVSLFLNPNVDAAEPTTKSTFLIPTALIATAPWTGTNWSTGLRLGSDGLTAWDDLTVATSWESLRTHQVMNAQDSGAGSLRQAVADASVAGARVTFSPFFGSLYAVAETNRLIRFHPETPGTVDLDVPITGLLGGEHVVALDFRIPFTDYTSENSGDLYALAARQAGDADECRIYRINPYTGAATLASASPAFMAQVPYQKRYGFDYHPTDDHFRIVNWGDDSIRFYPDSGAVFHDPALTLPPQPARLNAEAIAGIAYSPKNGALYGLDDGNLLVDIGSTDLSRQNAGAGRVIGSVGNVDEFTVSNGGFDISDAGISQNESAWLTALYRADNTFHLHSVDLVSGRSVDRGRIGTGALVIRALAAAPARIILKEGRQIVLSTPQGIILDGPASKGRVCLTNYYRGSSTGRVFDMAAGSSLSLHQLSFNIAASGDGGAIRTSGSLALDRCTFHSCGASNGGAVSAPGGLLRATRSSFSNCFVTNTGGAVDIGSATAVLTHCTFSGNRTSGTNPAFSGGGALSNASGTLTLTGCLIAGNTTASGVGADVWNSSVITAAGCVIGNGTSSGITETVANGNDVGSAGTPVPARLAPLGDYGGTTFTMPPLPGSTAIDRTRTSNSSGDQRGFLINNFPDAGAAEFRGAADMALYWLTDWDADGTPYGVEQATGTDPLVKSPGPLTITKDASGKPVVTFPRDPAGATRTRWLLKSSPNLQAPWTTVWSYNGVTDVELTTPSYSAQPYPWFPAIPIIGNGRSLTYLPAATGSLFWRLEAEYIP